MKISNAIVNNAIRNDIFSMLNIANIEGFQKINDRQFGILITDKNGEQRYARVGVIVAEQREDITAAELMQSEINTYNAKQVEKAEKARERAEKAKRDKERREKEKEKKEQEKEEE